MRRIFDEAPQGDANGFPVVWSTPAKPSPNSSGRIAGAISSPKARCSDSPRPSAAR